MRILVTNDDGIDSEGLAWLAGAVAAHGDVTVVAPDREYSGASASLGALNELRPEVRRARVDGVGEAWTVSGPPALCVMFATLGVFDRAFDLVVSGINPGVNVGRSVYHSGTVGAALTARSRGLPAIAVSQAVEGYGIEGQGWDEMLKGLHWEAAAQVASAVTAGLAGHGLLAPMVVNLNVPNLALADMAGWERTSIGRVPPRVIADARLEPHEGHSGAYRVVMEWGDAVSLPEGTDGGAVERDRVSLTLLGHLTEVEGLDDHGAEDAIYPALAAALDELFNRA
ncbi:MAG TPA: 5'/3'-nucleotidase SurE [Acidimicrobiales bacterium]|nr:5'/3'-nucleotidase SurE [Acidimicrobiales bacterium]